MQSAADALETVHVPAMWTFLKLKAVTRVTRETSIHPKNGSLKINAVDLMLKTAAPQ